MNSENAIHDPWYKTTLSYETLGTTLRLKVPHDVFSTFRIDEGTLLLLDHLPEREPRRVLDMGCGYGALGLPVAARFPDAEVVMVDRDLLAVAWALVNAQEHRLSNTRIHGSLGFRDIASGDERYDWILCNVPARIGRPFMEKLIVSGRSRLAKNGELRVVVIRDLVPVISAIAGDNGLPLREEATGAAHAVFSLAADTGAPATVADDMADLYYRDEVIVDGISFQRPFDLGGDDPKRLKSGIPVMLDVLANQKPKRVFCFRAGYGIFPVIARKRWPDAAVIVAERDLLAAAYTQRNAVQHQLAGNALQIRPFAHVPDAIQPDEKFDLLIGELSPSAGVKVARAELDAVARALSKGGDAYILVLEKLEKEWLKTFTKTPYTMNRLLAHEGYAVVHVSA
ncbi:MAG: methyltransferase [Spirochaetes bacterium]|nr:methyltransferase [Spirochaetota bacterium]